MHCSIAEFNLLSYFSSIKLCFTNFNMSGIDGVNPTTGFTWFLSSGIVVTAHNTAFNSSIILFTKSNQLILSCPGRGLLLCSVFCIKLSPLYTNGTNRCHKQSIHLSGVYPESGPKSLSLLISGLMTCYSISSSSSATILLCMLPQYILSFGI
jgi:hypothetical protein